VHEERQLLGYSVSLQGHSRYGAPVELYQIAEYGGERLVEESVWGNRRHWPLQRAQRFAVHRPGEVCSPAPHFIISTFAGGLIFIGLGCGSAPKSAKNKYIL